MKIIVNVDNPFYNGKKVIGVTLNTNNVDNVHSFKFDDEQKVNGNEYIGEVFCYEKNSNGAFKYDNQRGIHLKSFQGSIGIIYV